MHEGSESNVQGSSVPKLGSNDKRYMPRWEVDNRILYRLADQQSDSEARSVDISCSGTCISTNNPIPSNQKVELTIYLAEDMAIKAQGRVVWNKTYESRNLVGVIFVDVSPEVQELILDFAFEIKKDDVIKHWYQGWNNSN